MNADRLTPKCRARAKHFCCPGRICWPGRWGQSSTADLLEGYFFFRGTFLPFLRAFESAMAIACLRLFTLPPFPPLPLFAFPRL
jgi:hypothetical protein